MGVIKLFCQKDLADRNMEVLCKTGVRATDPGSSNRVHCSEAIVANSMADRCYSQNAEDADTCYKVCAWRDVGGRDERPQEEINRFLDMVLRPVRVFLAILIAWRVCACVGQMIAVC